jgi:hypothetical protein
MKKLAVTTITVLMLALPAQAKLDAMKLKPKQGDPLIGDITPFGGEWFKEWGVVTQDV